MTLYEIINLNTIFDLSLGELTLNALFATLCLFLIYIGLIKKRGLTKTEQIICITGILLAWVLSRIVISIG